MIPLKGSVVIPEIDLSFIDIKLEKSCKQILRHFVPANIIYLSNTQKFSSLALLILRGLCLQLGNPYLDPLEDNTTFNHGNTGMLPTASTCG